jgi:hypothetical protein
MAKFIKVEKIIMKLMIILYDLTLAAKVGIKQQLSIRSEYIAHGKLLLAVTRFCRVSVSLLPES